MALRPGSGARYQAKGSRLSFCLRQAKVAVPRGPFARAVHGRQRKVAGNMADMVTIREADLIDSVADALQYISYFHPMDYIRALGHAYEAEQGPA
eukprot:gene24508-30332_t